jgi:hypothetical protein
MINLRPCDKEFCVQRMLSVLTLLVSFSTAALSADSITGAVRNQTNGQPSVGDEVVLIGLDVGMREEARAKTDTHGGFTLPAPDPHKPYLLRVVHQGVDYDQRVSAGTALSISVFDAAVQVRGITGSIEILRTGTAGKLLLHVSDLYEIKNESSPPLTQAGERTFEVYLPTTAKIDSVLAAGPGNVGEAIFASPVPGEPGHYTVSFPLRPGATKFAFNYDLPYSGRAAFRTKLAYPLQQLAVMIPPTMKFSSRSPVFETLATGNAKYQVQVANQLREGEGPGFEVSGTGALPPFRDQGKSQARPQSTAVANPKASSPAHALSGTSGRIDSRVEHAQAHSQWLVLGGLIALLLAACVLLVWQIRTTQGVSGPRTGIRLASQNRQTESFSELLKKGLLRLEANGLRRSISTEEYNSTQQALELPAEYAVRNPSLRHHDG